METGRESPNQNYETLSTPAVSWVMKKNKKKRNKWIGRTIIISRQDLIQYFTLLINSKKKVLKERVDALDFVLVHKYTQLFMYA